MRSVFTASCFVAFEGKVLLVHHKFLDMWLPVGGELEPNEAPMDGAYRETLEETRIHVEFAHRMGQPHGTPPGFIGYEEHSAGTKGRHMNFCFLGHAKNRVVQKFGNIYALGEPLEAGLSPEPIGDGSWSEYRWVTPGDSSTYASLEMPHNVRDLLLLVSPLL